MAPAILGPCPTTPIMSDGQRLEQRVAHPGVPGSPGCPPPGSAPPLGGVEGQMAHAGVPQSPGRRPPQVAHVGVPQTPGCPPPQVAHVGVPQTPGRPPPGSAPKPGGHQVAQAGVPQSPGRLAPGSVPRPPLAPPRDPAAPFCAQAAPPQDAGLRPQSLGGNLPPPRAGTSQARGLVEEQHALLSSHTLLALRAAYAAGLQAGYSNACRDYAELCHTAQALTTKIFTIAATQAKQSMIIIVA